MQRRDQSLLRARLERPAHARVVHLHAHERALEPLGSLRQTRTRRTATDHRLHCLREHAELAPDDREDVTRIAVFDPRDPQIGIAVQQCGRDLAKHHRIAAEPVRGAEQSGIGSKQSAQIRVDALHQHQLPRRGAKLPGLRLGRDQRIDQLIAAHQQPGCDRLQPLRVAIQREHAFSGRQRHLRRVSRIAPGLAQRRRIGHRRRQRARRRQLAERRAHSRHQRTRRIERIEAGGIATRRLRMRECEARRGRFGGLQRSHSTRVIAGKLLQVH